MADRGMLFSPAMVQALRQGRKTQTRRGVTANVPDPKKPSDFDCNTQAGDRIWVRETWRCGASFDRMRADTILDVAQPGPFMIAYEAGGSSLIEWTDRVKHDQGDKDHGLGGKKRPSMFMPRWASRTTLIVTNVRIERLQDISEADALAEGVEYETADPPFYYVPGIYPHSLTGVEIREGAAACYGKLWNHINGPGAWEANPWVVATTFNVHKCNISEIV